MTKGKNKRNLHCQLAAMVRYELLLHYRRRGLIMVAALAAVLLTMLIFGMPKILPQSEDMPAWAELLNPGQMLASTTMSLIIVALPPLLADTIPLDRRSGMRELLKSLPLSNGIYLVGKVLGALAASALLWSGVVLLQTVLIWVAIGSFQSQFYLALIGLGVVPAFVFIVCASVLLAGGLQSRGMAALVGIALTGYCMAMTLISSTRLPRLGVLSPASAIAFSYLLDRWGAPFGIYQRSNPVSATDVTLSSVLGLVQIVVLALVVWIWLRRREGV